MLGKKVPKSQRQQNNNNKNNANNQKPKEEQLNIKYDSNTVNSVKRSARDNQNPIKPDPATINVSNLKESKKSKLVNFDSVEEIENEKIENLSLSDSSYKEDSKPKNLKAGKAKKNNKEISEFLEDEKPKAKSNIIINKYKVEEEKEIKLLDKKKVKNIDMLLSDSDYGSDYQKIKKQKKLNKKIKIEKEEDEMETVVQKDENDDGIVFEKNKFYESEGEEDQQVKEEIEDSEGDEKIYDNTKTEKKINTSKQKAKNKNFTVSIVIPSSIIDNAQSKELRSYLVGQIARTAGIFKIDEIIIFHDRNKSTDKDYINFFVTNLQYLETPQYLRKTLFPRCDDLASSGLMNPLDSNHHLRIDEWCEYREGVVLNRPVKENDGSWCNIGLLKDCKISQKLQEKTRVTVKLNDKDFGDRNLKYFTGNAVSVSEPKEKLNLYWGYLVRIANNFEEVFGQSSFNGEKYDFIIGTSDKGKNYKDASYEEYRDFKHCLIIFGGLSGIEGMIEYDEKSKIKDKDIEKLFDIYLNTCPEQGCRTIRTEEAIMISLSVMKPILNDMKQS